MIQGFDPRTAEPVGEPVAETTDAEVDAIVAAAAEATAAWGAGAALAQRAAALEAVADALDDRAGELAVLADTETALGGERPRRGAQPGPGCAPRPASDQPASRAGSGVRGLQLPVCVLGGGWRHCL